MYLLIAIVVNLFVYSLITIVWFR